jgi:hypothetical protein
MRQPVSPGLHNLISTVEREKKHSTVKKNGSPIALKFTPIAKQTFLSCIRQGLHLEHAASIAGVSYRTMLRHRREDPDFDEQVQAAEAMFVLATHLKMDELGKNNLDHFRWKLEKRFPALYGKLTAYNNNQIQQNNIVMAPLPTLDEVIAKVTEQRMKMLAQQIEREEAEDATIIDVESKTVTEESSSEP